MNEKEAKRLRKVARAMTVGKPYARYMQHKQNTKKVDKEGKPLLREEWRPFECTRATYKILKKAAHENRNNRF
jgi:hypothetical protein